MSHSLLTIDTEYDFETRKDRSVTEIVPKLLDYFDDHHIRATFSVLGDLARKHEDLLRDVARKHEVACHSYDHIPLRNVSKKTATEQIEKSVAAFKSIGIKLAGFRSPYFLMHPELGTLLKRHGFLYDSSISSFFPGRFNNLLTSTRPYLASAQNLKQRGKDIVELPVSNLTYCKFPSAGFSFYRLAYPLSKVLLNRRTYMSYLHPMELLDMDIGKEMAFPIRMFYGVNQGSKAWGILDDFIARNGRTRYITCKNYVERRFPSYARYHKSRTNF